MSSRIVLHSAAAGLTALLASACTITTTDATSDSGTTDAKSNVVDDSGAGVDTGLSVDAGTAPDAPTTSDVGTSADAAPSSDAATSPEAASGDSSVIDAAAGDASIVVVGNGCADPPSTNQTPATATPYTLGTAFRGCLRSGVDVNYYTYTVPTSPPKGGYVVVKLSDVGLQGTVDLTSQTASDSANLVEGYDTTSGGGVAQYFAAKPGATFRVVVKNHYTPPVATPETAYTLTATFTGVDDPNAPNGTVATAAKIMASTPVQGRFFAGFDSTTAPASVAWQNWFKISLPAGMATIALTNVPADITGDVVFFDSNTTQLTAQYNATAGGNVQFDATVATTGDYYLRLQPHYTPNPKGGDLNIPVWMTQPWTLTVTSK